MRYIHDHILIHWTMRPAIPMLAMSLLIGSSLPHGLMAQDSTRVVEVAFTTDMTEQDLERIREEVLGEGVELSYSGVRFNDAGLEQLAITVITEHGDLGKASTAQLVDSLRFGFRCEGKTLIVGTLSPPPKTQGPAKW